jgi:hypothetical protein
MISESHAWEMCQREVSEVETIGALKHSRGRQYSCQSRPRTDSSKHTICAWKVKYGGPDVNEAQSRIFLFSYFIMSTP